MATKKTKAVAKPTAKKLNEVQLEIAKKLVECADTGITGSNWDNSRRFPTRTLQVLTNQGLARVKDKKGETFWFPTAKTNKVLLNQAL